MTYLVKVISVCIFVLFTFCSYASEIKPAMWKVEYKGVTSFLFGSIHVGDKQWYPLPKDIMQAFDASDLLVVELEASKHQTQMAKWMLLPAGQTLKQNISSKTYLQLESYLASNGMSITAFSQFQPWAVATVVAVIPYLKAGLAPNWGLDAKLISYAQNKKMPVIELETPQFQIDLISGLFSDEKELTQMLELPEDDVKELINSWRIGDVNKLNTLISQQMTPVQRNLMLTQRNINWTRKLLQLLSTKQSYFVVVGAAHLAGSDGVPFLLANAGIKITRIK